MWQHYMAGQGYVSFTLDNRGTEGRGFDFESCIHRHLGDYEVKDQMRGVAFLRSLPWVDSTRIGVHGWSYGGFMTISMMLKNPGVFRVAVAGGPVTDWKYYEVMYGERYMDRPEENPDGYHQADLKNYVNNLNGHLLIIHGAMDSTVVWQHSLTLLRAFVKVRKQVDYFVYPTHPHNVRGWDRIHLMRKVSDYFEEYMK
jgi:dipeptidyl aminopeptidase/acylaminoacyl peptidase